MVERLSMANQKIIDWRIEMLGKFGGFSYRGIAKEVFQSADPTEAEKKQIYATLTKAGIRLRSWRDIDTKEATTFIKTTKAALIAKTKKRPTKTAKRKIA